MAFVWRGAQPVGDWSELAEKRIATWENSTMDLILERYGAAALRFNSSSQMYDALGRGEVDAIFDDEIISRCEVKMASARSSGMRYELQVFAPPAGVTLPFEYPEQMAAYVLNDGSSTILLEEVNRILGRADIRAEVEAIAETFLQSPDCRG